MAYGQEVAQAQKTQSAMESIMGQANSIQTMAMDLFNRIDRMDNRANGPRPTPIGAASQEKTATPQGFKFDLNDTLSAVHALLADCHSKMESLEGFI